jgi:hypothetical protein
LQRLSVSTKFPKRNARAPLQHRKGFWVKYNPSGFQTSGINTLEGLLGRERSGQGRDEDSTNFSGKDYKRSVSFVARLLEKN